MNQPSPLFPRSEWTMCSFEEASDRQRFKELSPLECTDSSYNAHPRERIPDPSRCVKKYRRSAAGGGVGDSNANERRSIDDLEATVDYLVGIIFCAQTASKESNARVSLLQSIFFVDDRIRAVQVDLTTLLGQPTAEFEFDSANSISNIIHKVRNIQAKILRYHLLSQHLLSSLTSKKYEWKFGHKALTTAISAFLATWDQQNNINKDQHDNYTNTYTDSDIAQLDEIMSYTTLLHIASVVNSREASIQPYASTLAQQQKQCGLTCEGGQGMTAILGLYRKYCPNTEERRRGMSHGDNNVPSLIEEAKNKNKGASSIIASASLPKYQWSLRIAGEVENGNYLSVIRLLTVSSQQQPPNQCHSLDDTKRWNIMARCCMAQVMPIIRIGLLRLYNKSFMKQEKVKHDDLVELLHLPNPTAVVSFCQNVGLPTVSSSTTDCVSVIMKAAPICIQVNNDKDEVIRQLTNPGRDEDYFVFGTFLNKWLSKNGEGAQKTAWDDNDVVDDASKGMSSLQKAMARAKISKQKNKVTTSNRNNSRDDNNDNAWMVHGLYNRFARTDEDGINILPSPVLRQLIL